MDPNSSLHVQHDFPGCHVRSPGLTRAGSLLSDSVKRHLSVLNLKFDFICDGGCTREKQIALSLKRHLFPHGGREPKAFWICSSRVHPPSEIKSNFKFKTLKRHLLKRHLTLSDSRYHGVAGRICPMGCIKSAGSMMERRKGPTVYEQSRSYLAFFRAFPASTWGHFFFFTATW